MENYQSKYTGAEIDGQLDKVTSLETEMSKKVNKTTTINGKALSSNITLTKGDIGLGNVDNTSDLNKPISTATQTAIDEETTARELGTNEYNVSILHPTSGVTSSGASGGNLYSLETASAIVGTNIKKGQVLSFYDKDKDGEVSKYEYNGTDWDELWQKKSKYMDDQYIKDELIDPLFGKSKGLDLANSSITKSFNSDSFSLEFYLHSDDVNRTNAGVSALVISSKALLYSASPSSQMRVLNTSFGGFPLPDLKEKLFHFVYTFNKSTYTHNVFLNSVSSGEKIDNNNTSMPPNLTFRFFQFRHFRLFNYALSADEVANLYNLGRPDKYILPNSYKNIDTTTETGCIGEYVPSSLTPKLWRDTSGQENDLVISDGAELIYTEPYSETLSGGGAPSIIPDFINQTYIDTTNKKKYCAFGTTAASDWKTLN